MRDEALQRMIQHLGVCAEEDYQSLLDEIRSKAEELGLDIQELFMQLGGQALRTGRVPLGHILADDIIARMQGGQDAESDMAGDAYLLKAYLYIEEEREPLSLENFHKSLRIMLDRQNWPGIANILAWCGDVYLKVGANLVAVIFYGTAARVYIRGNDLRGAAKNFFDTGRAFFRGGYFRLASRYCFQAQGFAAEAEDHELLEQIRDLTDRIDSDLENFANEFSQYMESPVWNSEEAVSYQDPLICVGLGESRMIAMRSWAPGPLDFPTKYEWNSQEYLQLAYLLFSELGQPEGITYCLFLRGKEAADDEDFQAALKFLHAAIDRVSGTDGHSFAKAAILKLLGMVYLVLSRYRDAIEYSAAAADLSENVKDKENAALCNMNAGVSLLRLGQMEQAIKFHQKALALTKFEKASIHVNLGNVYLQEGKLDKAREYYLQAMNDFNSRLNFSSMARCSGNLALVATMEGNFEEALSCSKAALDWASNTNNRLIQVKCHLNLAALYLSLSDLDEACASSCTAFEMGSAIGNWDLQRRALMIQAHVAAERKELEDAQSKAMQALSLAEEYGGSLEEESFKLDFSDDVASDYAFVVEVLLRLGQTENALTYIEKSKSQSLMNMLAIGEITPTVKTDPEMDALLAEERSCLKTLREVGKGHTYLHPSEMEKLRQELQKVYAALQPRDPEYVLLRRRTGLSCAEIRDMLAGQLRHGNDSSRTVLIEYFMLADGIYIFVVDTDGNLNVEKGLPPTERFNLLLENYSSEMLGSSAPGKAAPSDWQELGRDLLDPVAKYLEAGDHLCIIPHNFLHFLPIHSLRLNGEPLICRHSVSYAPSASVLKFLPRKGRGRLERCISFGVALDADEERSLSQLPPDQRAAKKRMQLIFEQEAHDVSSLLGGECLTGTEVTESAVTRGCIDRDLIHFSCHGQVDLQNPLESYLKLYDTRLTARQVFNLKLGAELVVLSACVTGLSWRRGGDDLLGLSRAFLYAGAASLLVSLWPVSQDSTRELMSIFYSRLQEGCNKAEAFRIAQLQVMKSYSHPYYWAAFALVGDWTM